MAIIILMAGALLGFLSAILALFLGMGFMSAFGLWISVGLLSSVASAVLAALPRSDLGTVRT